MKSRMMAYTTAMTLFSMMAVSLPVVAQNALALKYSVLYTFTGETDGSTPWSGSLIQDENGNLYGTTLQAGDLSACGGRGCGVVFKVDSRGNETVLYSFMGGADGANPYYGLVLDPAGNLYGTTFEGGDHGAGVVFELTGNGGQWTETPLYSFTGGTDGEDPNSGLVRDAEGNLYGTTYAGGDVSACGGQGCGVVYKVDPSGNETVLYSFTGPDGKTPTGDLLRDDAGNLYGTTSGGGASGNGAVFEVDPNGHEFVLYSFTGGADGGTPNAGLVEDDAGNLYGTTFLGGTSGAGVVFKVTPGNGESVLYSFTGGVDGGNPVAPLVLDPHNNLYGTTSYGGIGYLGVVFKLDPNGRETVLYPFSFLNGGIGGENPYAGLLRDNHGNLYGTTTSGGDSNGPQCIGNYGCGVVFKLSACRTAVCHGEDDADPTGAKINPATVMQHPSTVTPTNPALNDRATLSRRAAQRFPGDRPVDHATASMN